MFSSVKLGILALSLLFISGLVGCTDQEAEKRAQLAEERAIAAEKRAAVAEEKLLMLEKQMKDDAAKREASKKFREGRYEESDKMDWKF